MEAVDISDMVGKTFFWVKIKDYNEALWFYGFDYNYLMFHYQNCCEYVRIVDICGDLHALEGVPIIKAYASSSDEIPNEDYDASYTWTFYHLATIKGYVTIRWLGTSNGYYSEKVDIVRIKK
jgi:hypothetical protein